MKTGRSLNNLAAELTRQLGSKRDFMADSRNMIVSAPAKKDAPLTVALKDVHAFDIRPNALRQMYSHVGLPAKFADMLESKHMDLLVHNLNELLHRTPSQRLVRTLDNNVRAYLGSTYRRIDNYDYAENVLAVCEKFPVEVQSCEVTESRLYIKVVRTDMEEKIGYKQHWRQGEGHNFFQRIRPAAVFSNSEVGAGSLWFSDAIFTRECTNLAVFEDKAFEKIHVGRRNNSGDDGLLELVMSDQTKQLEDAALWGTVRDLAAGALGGKLFTKRVEQLTGATQNKIEGDPAKTIEMTSERYGLNEQEQGGLLKHLIQGGDLSQYGLHGAMTRLSQDLPNYDRATELERFGAKIIELPQSEWKTLAEAA